MRSTPPVLPAVTLLGPPIEHREGLEAALRGQAAAVHWMPDSYTFLRGLSQPQRRRWSRKLDALLGTRDPAYLDLLSKAMDTWQPEIVVAYWGTLPVADIIALKRMRPGVKVVLMMLCYPLSLQTPGLLRQRLLLSHAARHVDGVICPGPEMADYLTRHEFAGSQASFSQVRPCWPAGFHATTQSAAVSAQPHVVYVGRPDLSGVTVHVADDVRQQLLQLLEAGIRLSHGQSKEMSDGHPLRHQFEAVPVPELTVRMSGYDASLMAYNLAACKRKERFEFTVPDRLISSVAAGVPIAIPTVGYAASKTYLRDYPAVIEFDSPQSLRRSLDDRDAVARLRERAWQSRAGYTAEAQSGAVVRALQAVLQP